jgi:glutaredoxin 3
MFCDIVKEFLSQKGIEFTERDVTVDELAIAELEELGFMTTPVTVIDGEVVIGFDRQRLVELLDG